MIPEPATRHPVLEIRLDLEKESWRMESIVSEGKLRSSAENRRQEMD
jgi:hypothetical protein